MTKTNMKQRKNRKAKSNVIIFSIAMGLLTPVLLVYLAISLYYNSHFYSNTLINGVSTSNMNVKEAEKEINSEVARYVLNIEGRNNISDTIRGKSINLHTEFNNNLEEVLSKQKSLAWPISYFKPTSVKVNTMLKYDEILLKDQVDQLNCLKDENTIEPENAKISEYGENGYEIVPEVQGTKVIKQILFDAVEKSINTLKPSLKLEEVKCYEKPEIDSKYKELVNALTQMNKIAGTKITYEFGDATEILDGSRISKWLSVDDNFKVDFDQQGIKEYVDYIGKTYNSFGRIRTFKTSYKKTIKVKGGDYGWWLNRPEEVSELTELIMNGEQQKREPVYFQTAQQYGADDIGDTYVEINLTAQHLYFYKEGRLILQSDFVSGNVSKKLETPVGTYPIQYKQKDATLNGEDYSTPVKYWMPFNGNVGLHDAPWRSEFGKDIYLTNGSHGCINMPPAKAKLLFENINRGVAVVVYKMKGTENYEVKPKDQTKTAEPTKAAEADASNTISNTANKTSSNTVKKTTSVNTTNSKNKKATDKKKTSDGATQETTN